MRCPFLLAFTLVAALPFTSACDDSSKSAAPSASSAPDDGSAKPTATAAAKKSAIADFFDGPAPAGVELTKSYTAYDPKYTMIIPNSWKTGGNRADEYMAMRSDSTGAVFCGWGGVSVGKLKTLAKRAPAAGKDVTLEGEPELVRIGTDPKFTARAGTGTGNLFKEDGGRLYWMEVSFEDSYGGDATTGSVHCLIAIRAGVPDEVLNEAKAIMRSFSPPKGKKMLEPTKLSLFDESTK
jgi:hypothetical protein